MATLSGCVAFGAAPSPRSSSVPTAGLYDSDAGFLQARTGAAPAAPIRVGALPGFDIDAVLDVWNTDAGRVIAVVDADDPQVTFVGDLPRTGRAAWVEPLPDRFGPYTSCVIHYDPSRLRRGLGIDGMRHEFGHCLGFRDIEFFPQENLNDNQQCNAPSKPNYNGAALRMSYCYFRKPELWGGLGDRRSLYAAGYGVLES